MRKDLAIVISGLILLAGILSGCTHGTEVDEELEKVFFESDVVNLLNFTLDYEKSSSGVVARATANGIIENKLEKIIDVKIIVDFIDDEGNLIHEGNYRIYGLRVKPGAGSSTSFTVSYNGENVEKITDAKIYINEIV